MGVLIDTVRIAGFRGIRNVEISLPRVAVLIGTNNSGKTSVIKALQLALGDYSRYLTDEDFHIDSDDVRCEKIVVDIRVVSVDENGMRQPDFETDWVREFEDRIQEETDGKKFLGIRTVAEPDEVKGVEAMSLPTSLSTGDIDLLNRKVMMSRGDILFAKALILGEGETEEQLIPAMFEIYYGGLSTFEKGVTCIGVGGKQYEPFVIFGCSLGIPVCIISDNDGETKKDIKSQVGKTKKEYGLELDENVFSLQFLSGNNDIEAELVNVLRIREEIIEALISVKTRGSDNQRHIDSVREKMNDLTDEDLLEKITTRGIKAPFAGFLSDVIRRNPNGRKENELCPEAVIKAFGQVERWLA